VTEVKNHWKGNNVDLSLLSKHVVKFFEERQFTTSISVKEEGCIIVAAPKPSHGIVEKIKVKVFGNPDDFTVEFVAGSRSQNFVRYGTLLSLIGGGFLVLKGLKSLEELEKLEKEFWSFVHDAVWRLTKAQ